MLEKAIALANDLVYDPQKERIAAVITDRRGNVLSMGVNSYTDSCRLQRFFAKCVGMDDKVFNHAEIVALKNLPKDSKPYAIYVARTNRKGEPLLAKPCKVCEAAIINFGIIVVHYTD